MTRLDSATTNTMAQPPAPAAREIVTGDGRRAPALTKRKVVSEEEFSERLNEIIRRDFFPRLERLRQQNRLLDTIHDPAQLPRVLAELRDEEAAARGVDAASLPSLDEYLARYISEDDASFEVVLDRCNRARRDAQPWFRDGPLAITDGRERFGGPKGWAFRHKNALMFPPDAPPQQPDKALLALPAAKRRAVDASNTRMVDDDGFAIPDIPAARHFDKTPVPGGAVEIGTPIVNGYKMVATTPVPGGDESPIITWGKVATTPIPLSAGAAAATTTTSSSTGAGSAFRIRPVDRREDLAQRLADRASTTSRTPTPGATPRTPHTPRTPGGAAPVSDAARRLARRLRSGSRSAAKATDADQMLRSSYGATPVLATKR